MTAALWVIAACQVTERLLSVRGLRAKGFLRPIKRLRERGKIDHRTIRVTERP